MPGDIDPAVRSAIVQRCRELCAENDQTEEAILRLQAHQRSLAEQIKGCLAAARVFGFDLVPDCRPEPSETDSNRPTIRDLVLDAARQAYPAPIRAHELRRQLAARGYPTHEATARMYLYRWFRKGLIRRDGFNWYFVPPPNEESDPRDCGGREIGKTTGRPMTQSAMAA